MSLPPPMPHWVSHLILLCSFRTVWRWNATWRVNPSWRLTANLKLILTQTHGTTSGRSQWTRASAPVPPGPRPAPPLLLTLPQHPPSQCGSLTGRQSRNSPVSTSVAIHIKGQTRSVCIVSVPTVQRPVLCHGTRVAVDQHPQDHLIGTLGQNRTISLRWNSLQILDAQPCPSPCQRWWRWQLQQCRRHLVPDLMTVGANPWPNLHADIVIWVRIASDGSIGVRILDAKKSTRKVPISRLICEHIQVNRVILRWLGWLARQLVLKISS